MCPVFYGCQLASTVPELVLSSGTLHMENENINGNTQIIHERSQHVGFIPL